MKAIHACIIGTILLLHASAEVRPEKSKNAEERNPSVEVAADAVQFFPEGTAIDDTYYRAALLPSMMRKREEKGNVRFRLAIIPSFSKPLFLTYSRRADGASIEITRLQLRWDNDVLHPVGVELSGKVDVGNHIAELLEDEVLRPRIRTPLSYLSKEQRQMIQGLDGTTYVIEVSTETDYTVQCVWTPEAIITEKALLKVLSQQKVDVKSMVDDLKKLIAFRDHLLDVVGIKEPRYSISELLEDG